MTRDLSKLVGDKPIKLLPTKADRIARKKKNTNNGNDNAGPSWFNMPAAIRTPELENDIRLLTMREALDPKQHYKKGDKVLQGKYFQVGTVIADPTCRYTDKMTRRQRGNTILDTLMRDSERQQYFKEKYNALQQRNARHGRLPRVTKGFKK